MNEDTEYKPLVSITAQLSSFILENNPKYPIRKITFNNAIPKMIEIEIKLDAINLLVSITSCLSNQLKIIQSPQAMTSNIKYIKITLKENIKLIIEKIAENNFISSTAHNMYKKQLELLENPKEKNIAYTKEKTITFFSKDLNVQNKKLTSKSILKFKSLTPIAEDNPHSLFTQKK